MGEWDAEGDSDSVTALRNDTLADALPRQMARNRELSQVYAAIGPAGMFGKAGIDADLAAAEKASAEQDLPAMIAAYQRLKANK